jgi:hypothetical protein
MGVGSLYQYGTVTDYSIKTQMNDADPGRGFTWGRLSTAPIASLNATSGNMQIAGTFASSNFSGSSSGTNSGDQTLSGLGGVPTSRSLTINGTAYDLSADRSWTVTASDATKLPLAGGTMTGTITITNTDIRSNSTSNWTGDPGTQGKIQYHSARWYIVSDSASDRIVQFRRNGTDVSYIDNSGNFIGNASTATSAGSASTAGYASSAGSAPNASNLNSMYGVSTGGGNGLKFWGGSDLYKIHMGSSAEYYYGPVTDYSIKCNIDSNGSTRGFTWGQNGVTPIAALNVGNGNMQIAGTFTSGGSILPLSNGTLNLGSSSARWNTVFTSDLSLNNGIGDYTIVEGENDLFLYNNKQNKVYKFMLQEVNANDATPKRPE